MLPLLSNSKLKNALECQTNTSALRNKEDLKLETHNQIKSMIPDTINFVEKIARDYYTNVALIQDISQLLQKQETSSYKLQHLMQKLEHKRKREQDKENEESIRKRHYNLYKKNLGLTITTVKGLKEDNKQLKFTFININRKNAQEEFSFCLHIDEKDRYCVLYCNPKIVEMDALLKELNETNELDSFILKVRKKFCVIATGNSSEK